MTETYYAIRIGDPRRHSPYLMVRDQSNTPRLFLTKHDAAEHLALERMPCRKVVRVRIKVQ